MASLSPTAIKNAKPKERPYKLYDEKGLFLVITPQGGKWWRFKYQFDGKEKLLSLGTYPEVPLAGHKNKLTGTWINGARDKRDEARKLIAAGIDPSESKKAIKSAQNENAANSFEVIAREWFNKFSSSWVENHANRIMRRFECDIFTRMGSRPIAEITAPEILSVIRKIEDRGAIETAHRTLQNCSQVFRYAVATGRAERDPTQDLKGALPPVKEKHFAAVTDPNKVGELLRAFDSYKGTFAVKCALRLAPLVFVRPGELRHAEWAHIDLDAAEWRYTVTKTETPHIVPLSTQAISILRELHPLTGHGRFVFPSARNPRGDRPMSDNAILSAMRRLGIEKDEMSGHGFRAMARTILDEVLGIRPDYIEHQLAHAVRDPNGRAYNRTAHLPERRAMMQKWADYLDECRTKVN